MATTAVDAFSGHTPGLDSPYTHGAAISTSDSADLANVTRAIAVGVAGTVKVDMAGGETGITLTLPVGIHRLRVTKVYATGTAATGLVALW